jgi:parallel beta-helix repeat protein
VTTTADAGTGSLRWAIEQANMNMGPDEIAFHPSIAGGVIQPGTALPYVTDDDTTIDGDINGDGAPDITLDGTFTPGTWTTGISLHSARNVVRGLVVRRFNNSGITAYGPLAQANRIEGNTAAHNEGNGLATATGASASLEGNIASDNGYADIGVYGASAATIRGNTLSRSWEYGITVGGGSTATIESNTIDHAGGDGVCVRNRATATIRGNTISQSGRDGVRVADGTRVSRAVKATIEGNDIAGAGRHGVYVKDWDPDPPEPVEAIVLDNVIRDNAGTGVRVSHSTGIVRGNTISGSGENGVGVFSDATAAMEQNTISASQYNGMWLSGSLGLTVAGNTVSDSGSNGIALGTGATAAITGNLALGNGGNGIALHGGSAADVESNTVIGSAAHGIAFWEANAGTISQNCVSGSGWSGIHVAGSSTATVTGNEVSGSVEHGIHWNNAVGWVLGDTIYGNGGDGVAIRNNSYATVSRCSIYENGGLGIDLGDDGVTPNDGPTAPDTGPNDLLNFPVLGDPVVSGNAATFTGTALPGSTVEVFTAAPDPSDHGEGMTYLLSVPAHEVHGTFSFTVSLFDLPVTATATDQYGNTSEFCQVPGRAEIAEVVALEALITYGVATGEIDPELATGLVAKVDVALAALARGNRNDAQVAMNQLKALVKEAEAQAGNKITPAMADEIVALANGIIAALGTT